MKDMIERALSTRDKDENIMGMVTFPCNEEEVLQRFQVDDLKELYFVDRSDSRMSVARFNHIIREADARAEKINSMIGTAVCFLMDKLDQNPCRSILRTRRSGTGA